MDGKERVEERRIYEEETPRKASPFVKNLIIAASLLAVVVLVLSVLAMLEPKKEEGKIDWNIRDICELTTLKCRYHNVAIGGQEGGFLGVGYKELWVEYDAELRVGIDVNKVIIEQPTPEGVVRIYVPEATILSDAVDTKSMKTLVSDEGIFTSLTVEDEQKVVLEAHANMKENALTEKYIFKQARDNAKKLLEQHVLNIGDQTNKRYTIEWIEKGE